MEWLKPYADLLIAMGQVGIVVATLPMLLPNDKKPSFFVCVSTTCCMALVTLGVIGLGLVISTTTSVLVTLQWCIVSVQRRQIDTRAEILFSKLYSYWNRLMYDIGR